MSICPVCNKSFSSNKSLVQHTESAHGRGGVYDGVVAWENSRDQSGMMTTGVSGGDYLYQILDSQYCVTRELGFVRIVRILFLKRINCSNTWTQAFMNKNDMHVKSAQGSFQVLVG